MPLYVDAHLIVTKVSDDEGDPRAYRLLFSDKEIEEIRSSLLEIKQLLDLGIDKKYSIIVHDISFIKPTKDLTTIQVPLADLRKAIVDQMTAGISVMDLENLLYLIRTVYRESRD